MANEEYKFNAELNIENDVFSAKVNMQPYIVSSDFGDVVNVGVDTHSQLLGRNEPNQHIITSITGLEDELKTFALKSDLDSKANIRIGTVEYWNSIPKDVANKGEIIVYSNAVKQGNYLIPKIKIGDGLAFTIDLPYVNQDLQLILDSHIADTEIHITQQEREFWNNKITAGVKPIDKECLILTKKELED